jgi:hypothetical protein
VPVGELPPRCVLVAAVQLDQLVPAAPHQRAALISAIYVVSYLAVSIRALVGLTDDCPSRPARPWPTAAWSPWIAVVVALGLRDVRDTVVRRSHGRAPCRSGQVLRRDMIVDRGRSPSRCVFSARGWRASRRSRPRRKPEASSLAPMIQFLDPNQFDLA